MSESIPLALKRWRDVELLRQEYPTFGPFLVDMMEVLGFRTSELQLDIASYIEHGPDYLMIQAQRGQAKTTITAIYAVWALIHNPKLRILIVSAGSTQANEISTLVVRFIMTVDILEPMRPDKQAGDRTSVEAFDVHHSLKGLDKSPSVACVGVTANLQGKRADLLIADDVESAKNSATALMREQLLNITRDFVSINQTGRILYLGTPQSIESIYNTLPGRGFTVRVWPGRYPNEEQRALYGDTLAPRIVRALDADPTLGTGFGIDGKQGKCTDPILLDDEKLLKKELDQGTAYFTLQHMLLTAMTDAMRFPLKTQGMILMPLAPQHLPMEVVRGMGNNARKTVNVGSKAYVVSTPHSVSEQVSKPLTKVMYVDPAGGGMNADETAWAVVSHLNHNLFVHDICGQPGGYSLPLLESLAEEVVRQAPSVLVIEKNMGFGAFREVFLPVLHRKCKEAGVKQPPIQDDLVTGQKELRIIATLEPVLGRGALVFDDGLPERDTSSIQRYELARRHTYSFFHQLSKLTRDRDSLVHDDRIDALEGAVRFLQAALAQDQSHALKAQEAAEHKTWAANPLGYTHGKWAKAPTGRNPSLSRIRRI